MYKSKRSILLSFILLLSLIFAASSEAAKFITKEEFFSALYDARGIELTVDKTDKNAKNGKKLTSASDKAAACFKLGYAGMPNTGIFKANAPEAGKLNAPLTRVEAIRYIIQSLGLSFEAAVLSRLPSTFSDMSQHSAFERGCVTVAERMYPPLIDEKVKTSKTFKPNDRLTKEELSGLMANVKSAVSDLLLDLDVSPAQGIIIKMHREGTFTGAPRWRVNLHGFESEEEANVAAAQIKEVEMKPQFVNYEWSLRGELLDDWRRVEKVFGMVQPLNKQTAIVPSVINAAGENQPYFWVLATVPPNDFNFRILTPPSGISALSAMSQMTGGSGGPILSVNAGYFTWTGKLKGSPIGTLVADGELAHAPYLRRTTIGWGSDNIPIFGYPEWRRQINLEGSQSENLDRINFYSKTTLLTSYTSLYKIPTPTPEVITTEILIKDGRCVGKAHGGTIVNKGDMIIAAYGPKAYWLDRINPGDPIDIGAELTPGEGDFNDWSNVVSAVQAGPMLVIDGAVNINSEGFDSSFVNSRHPRSAVGVDAVGNWMLFVGDGRNGMHSIGYSLAETATIMQQLGAEQVLNFDGGGSSEMLVKGQFFNWPSEGKERAISNAVGVFGAAGE